MSQWPDGSLYDCGDFARFRRGRRIGRLACHRRAGCLRVGLRWRSGGEPVPKLVVATRQLAVVGDDA